MKRIVCFMLLVLGVSAFTAAAQENEIASKIKAVLAEGWVIAEKSDGIKMYERAAQSLGIQNPAALAGSMFTITNTKITVPKDAFHAKDYHPYFEIFVYKISLTEEQIVKYNRLVNALYNRPAGTQEEFPPRFSFQKGEYVVMKGPAWGKAATTGMDGLMLKIISLVKKELS